LPQQRGTRDLCTPASCQDLLRSKPFPIHQYSYHLTLSLVWVKHHDTKPKKVTKCYWLFVLLPLDSEFLNVNFRLFQLNH